MQRKRIDLGHVTLSYGDSETPGSEVVFVHGYPARWESYRPFLEALSADFRVLAPSFRGMGDSARADSYRVPDFIGDIAAFIRAVSTPPTLVVGQGGGPWFAAAAAATEPDLLAALVSMDEAFSSETNIAGNVGLMPLRAGTAEARQASSNYEDFLTRFADVPIGDGQTFADLGEERLLRNAELSWTLDPEVLAHWRSEDALRAFLDVPELQVLPGDYRGPVLFVSGDPESGWSCTPEDNDHNLGLYPWAELVVLDGTDTFALMREDPERLASTITPFLLTFAGR